MRELGIRGVKRGRRVITTRRDDTAARSPDLVKPELHGHGSEPACGSPT